ncbi:MAG: fibronectin type III domain-containing protein [Planctomycetota bacterium]
MKLSAITKFVTNNPERVVFGVCAIVFLVVLAGYLSGGKDNEAVYAARQPALELKDVVRTNELAEKLGPVEYLKKVKVTWEEIQQATEGKTWLMYRPPVVYVEFRKEAPITREKKSNLSPIAKSVITDTNKPDEVTLSWNGNISSTAQIKSYKVYRQAKGEKDFTAVAEVQAVTPTESGYTHIDKGVKPETEYSYYLTAVSDDPDAVKAESDRSGELKTVTPDDYKIEFIDVIVEKNSLYAKIHKYLNGKWDNAMAFISKGDKIDKDKFITGWTFMDFQPDVYEVSKAGGVIKKKTFRVFYLDKRGKEGNFLIPPK